MFRSFGLVWRIESCVSIEVTRPRAQVLRDRLGQSIWMSCSWLSSSPEVGSFSNEYLRTNYDRHYISRFLASVQDCDIERRTVNDSMTKS